MTLDHLKRLSRGHLIIVKDPRSTSPGTLKSRAFFEGLTQRRDGRDAVRVRLQWYGPEHQSNDGYVRTVTLLDPKEVLH